MILEIMYSDIFTWKIKKHRPKEGGDMHGDMKLVHRL